MEENTAGLGSGRDDEIDFEFGDEEEYTTNYSTEGSRRVEEAASEAHAAEAKPSDETGRDDVLYDDDDEEDEEHAGDHAEDADQQEHADENEIDYEDVAQQEVADDEQRDSTHDAHYEAEYQDHADRANWNTDRGNYEDQTEDFDFENGNQQSGYAHPEDEYDIGAEAGRFTGERPQLSTAHYSEQADSGFRDAESNMDQGTRDLGFGLDAFPHVMVTWGDEVCPLFKESEDGDPDSYYLDNLEALHYKLSEFLKAMRANMAQWINDSDEIHISIEELKFEFSETTTPVLLDRVTFQHLVALHEKLVQNDGPDASQTLHLTLTTRKNCTLRLGELIQAANDGRGLSSFNSTPSHMSSEHENHGDNASYDDYHGDDSGEMDETGQVFNQDIDEIGDGSHTLNTDRGESRGVSAAVSPHPASNADLVWAPGVDAADLVAGSEGTGPQQAFVEANDVVASELDQNDLIDYEVETEAIDPVAAALEPTTEDQLDLIDYSNEIASHGLDELDSAEDPLTEMPSMIAAVDGTDVGNDLLTEDGNLEAALAPTLSLGNEADLLGFGQDMVGTDGQSFLGEDGNGPCFPLWTSARHSEQRMSTVNSAQRVRTQAAAHNTCAYPYRPSGDVLQGASKAPAVPAPVTDDWEIDFDDDFDPSDFKTQTNSHITLDSKSRLDGVAEDTATKAVDEPSSEAFQLDVGQGDDEFLDIGAGDVETDALAAASGNTATTGATPKVTSDEMPSLDLTSIVETSQVDTAPAGDISNQTPIGSLATEDATAPLEQPTKNDDLDEIDWDDEDKVIVPITPTSATPNTNGKRTRDAEEADSPVDSGHDLKRHRPDQLLS